MNQQDNQSIISEGVTEGGFGEDLSVSNADAIKGGPSRLTGRRGGSSTVADDVIVDGRIITAENYD